jgi:ribose transport system permease protein
MSVTQEKQNVASSNAGQPLRNPTRVDFSRRLHEIGLPAAVLGLIIFFSLTSHVFFSGPNFRNMGMAAAALAAVSFGQSFAIMTAGLDLSVGSTVALVSIVASLTMRKYGVPSGILSALAIGGLVGLANGLVITRLRVVPFIATLAMLSVLSGLALNVSGGLPVSGLPASFNNFAYSIVFGIPLPVIVALATLVVAQLLLRYTKFGRRIYAVGGNQEAARLSGINTDRVKLAAYVVCGICAAIGSIILTSRVGSGQPSLGASLPLESVAAVVLGGVSLFGGRGSVIGVAFGVAFVTILGNGLNLLNVSSYTQMMVVGIALIAAVAIDQMVVRREGAR